MNFKDFLFNENFSSIQKTFLYYDIAHIPSPRTSVEKGYYDLNALKLDCKQNFELRFPKIKEKKFEKLFNEIINKLSENNIDYLRNFNLENAKLIYKLNEDQILDFIKSRIKKLNSDDRNLLLDFLNNFTGSILEDSKLSDFKNCDLIVFLGLLFKGTYYETKEGDIDISKSYYFPVYYSDIRKKIISFIEENYKKSSSKPKQVYKFEKSLDKKEKVYKLKVIFKGKKDKKAIKIGFSRFEVGAEFGGQDFKTIEIKCGKCGKSDKFIIENPQEILLRCGKCNSLNQPIGKDKEILK
ncbi:MAG: hypothetical protein ACTSQP_21725 [Promethearchaeota archaeon]